jgi:hypothetical protein
MVKRQTDKTRLKLEKRKQKNRQRIELDNLRKENPERYDEIIGKMNIRTQKERQKQVDELRRKLNGIGIPDFQLTEFGTICRTFIETGNAIKKELHFGGMLNGAYLELELNAGRDKECSITTKNVRVDENALREL